jgi:hypothetical protein
VHRSAPNTAPFHKNCRIGQSYHTGLVWRGRNALGASGFFFTNRIYPVLGVRNNRVGILKRSCAGSTASIHPGHIFHLISYKATWDVVSCSANTSLNISVQYTKHGTRRFRHHPRACNRVRGTHVSSIPLPSVPEKAQNSKTYESYR